MRKTPHERCLENNYTRWSLSLHVCHVYNKYIIRNSKMVKNLNVYQWVFPKFSYRDISQYATIIS